MARPDPTIKPCSHLGVAVAGSAFPFTVELVLDEHLGMTDAIVCCNECRQVYLLELVEWPDGAPHVRRYRTSLVDAADWARLRHDSKRAYCDLERMHGELHALQTNARLTAWLVELDLRQRVITSCEPSSREEIPTR